ncbi:uncharacterized protein [Leptinotarsa decemlineata]|uniref:uncharacterized protein n=1 Tax=Leptinotarsa decemlineata TaxID=7539 RepID=UPI000C251BAD|nr:uncharacterized protein LOC111512684 [Leptinotarsa decemlineata]
MMGLGGIRGELIYNRTSYTPRTYIIRKGINILPLSNLCSRDLTAVKIKTAGGGGTEEIVIVSAYLPYDSPEPPPTREVEELVRACQAEGLQLIIGCDANAHHLTWGSTNTNERGEHLLQFIMANNLDILNISNKPTFVNARCSEVIDVTIGTTFVSNYVRKWNVSDEESCSDHRHINFEIGGIQTSILTYQNPRKTNWGAYTVDPETCLDRMDFDIH